MNRLHLPKIDTEKVTVRFAPKPSGYLHLGHVKELFMNQIIREDFGADFIVRFNDTNPQKDKNEFKNSIIEDLELMHIKSDKITYTSDYFDILIIKCFELVQKGKAYLDNTSDDIMRKERNEGIESKCRNQNILENINLFNEFIKDGNSGYCVRAKIDYINKNKCLRDPVIYRSSNFEHPRTGFKYTCYPTYDFCCPIVDNIENITYALHAVKYYDHRKIYDWITETLGLRCIYLYHFTKINFKNCVMSKHKLKWLIDNGHVDGWDDPRLPTIRGLMKAGLTIEGLKKYIIELGNGKGYVCAEWDKLWATNKKIIDPICPRVSSVDTVRPYRVIISNIQDEDRHVLRHPKNEELGKRVSKIRKTFLINGFDGDILKPDDEVSLLNFGNIKVINVNYLEIKAEFTDMDFKKTKLKLNWVSEDSQTRRLITYDHLICKEKLYEEDDIEDYINECSTTFTDVYVEDDINRYVSGDIIQFERRGYYIVKDINTLIFIRSGKNKGMIS
jgi:glutamyl/glutaminyl-tRNA synthetase